MAAEQSDLSRWAEGQPPHKSPRRCWLCDDHPQLSAEIWEVADLMASGKSSATVSALQKHLAAEYQYPRSVSALQYHLKNHGHRRDEG